MTISLFTIDTNKSWSRHNNRMKRFSKLPIWKYRFENKDRVEINLILFKMGIQDLNIVPKILNKIYTRIYLFLRDYFSLT